MVHFPDKQFFGSWSESIDYHIDFLSVATLHSIKYGIFFSCHVFEKTRVFQHLKLFLDFQTISNNKILLFLNKTIVPKEKPKYRESEQSRDKMAMTAMPPVRSISIWDDDSMEHPFAHTFTPLFPCPSKREKSILSLLCCLDFWINRCLQKLNVWNNANEINFYWELF